MSASDYFRVRRGTVHVPSECYRLVYIIACFVDFQKAFDSVEHCLLWQKLADSGISDKLLHLLQSMYGNASSAL